MTGLYCSSDSLLCERRLPQGLSCSSDNQCLSGNCDTNDICMALPETIQSVPRYLYALVPIFIFLVMVATVAGLWQCHQRARKRRSRVLHEYWTEQLAYRQSIMSMHLAAKNGSRGKRDNRRDEIDETDKKRRNSLSDDKSSVGSACYSETSSESTDKMKRRRAVTTGGRP